MQTFINPEINEIARKLNLPADEISKMDADTFMEIRNDSTLSESEKVNMYQEIYKKRTKSS